MKKISVLLGGVAAALVMTGCGAMPELTQEENELISEYAVGVLLKYDKAHGRRLVDTTGYEVPEEEPEPEEPVEEPIEEEEPEPEETEPVEVVDVSEDEEQAEPSVSSVEQYYGIPNIMITYQGCEITDSYPQTQEGETLFFSMDATQGQQLLVLKFNAQNLSGEDQALNMLGYGASFRVSVNGEPSKGALATMLVNDMQTYNSVIPAGTAVDLVSIVEVPQGTNTGTIDFILHGGEAEGILHLQ
ncbi:MAG: hypothetical protein NC302_10590 [Bacteroidales bacterium]|nr:hypothetical protein [Bacteroidales bacterium]MCM1416525.1 hypothetical protein [bacterium]MCM1424538.1 hypothetical protein [bacterium]